MNRNAFMSRLLVPITFGVCLYLILPTLIVLPISFTENNYISFPPKGFSFKWYSSFFQEGPWRDATVTSLIIAAITTLVSTSIGTLAALGLRKLSKKVSCLVIIILLLPMIIPSIIIAVSLYGMFSNIGILGTYIGLVLAHTVITLPFVFISVSAVTQKINWSTVDAANSLGAGPFTAFRKVTFPALFPGIVSGAVFAFLTSFDEVVISLFITGVSTVTLPIQMWNGIRFEVSPSVAAAAGIMVLLSLIFLSVYSAMNYMFKRREAINSLA